jgi:glycosyltransferase involved in cell wall biosynthesis
MATFNDPRIKLFTNERNLGYLKTCNKLFTLCTGDYITFLDADDTCEPDRIEKQLAAFSQDPALGLVGTWVHITGPAGQLLRENRRPVSHEEIMKEIYRQNPFCSATVMIKKDVYHTIGGYREAFDGYSYQDYDWTFLIAEKYKSINLPEFLYSYRQHEHSNSKAVTIERRIGDKLVLALARQRADKGYDCLQAGAVDEFAKLVDELSTPYREDQSLLYQETAVALLYAGLAKKALRVSWKAVCKDPFKFRNYRTLKYAVVEFLKAQLKS